MASDQPAQETLQTQFAALMEMMGKVNESLKLFQASLPRGTVTNLTNLEYMLSRLSGQVKELEEQGRNQAALADISQAVNSTLELDEVLRVVMDTIVRLTGAERGFLMLRDADGEMVNRVARNWEQESINPSEFAISRTIIQRVIESGVSVLTTNAQEDPRFGGQESIIAYNLRSILCVPLKVRDVLTGVIYADNRIRTGIFTDTERELLRVFANQAAIAIENARLFASVRRTLAEVTELKNLMDNVFASIASGVITADIKNQIMLCNRAAERILGQGTSELIGHRLDEVLPGVARDIRPYLESVRRTNKPVVGLELSHTLPERGEVDWHLNLSPLKDANQVTQGVTIVVDDITEHRRLEAQRRLLERMVSPAVIAQIDPDALQIGGKRVDLTLMFADVRGFTAFGETQPPEKLVEVLNRYLVIGAESVLAYEGTVDKFLGDGVMAWFNAPIPQPDHTLRAVKAALALRKAVAKLHAELQDKAQLSFGVGIHYGEAVLGWIGSEKRLDYTAIGDSVNTAKRIQENTNPNQILISAEAYEKVRDLVQVSRRKLLKVKGKSRTVQVFELVGLK